MKNSYRVQRKNGSFVCQVRGETSGARIAELRAVLLEALEEEGCRRLVLDANAVSFMDSSGINLLVTLHKSAQIAGKSFVLLRPSEAVRKVLTLVQLLDFFDVRDSLEG